MSETPPLCYFDANASYPLLGELRKYGDFAFGSKLIHANPSANYQIAKQNRKIMEQGRRLFLEALKVSECDFKVCYTSSATEAINQVISSFCRQNSKASLCCSMIDHPCVLCSAKSWVSEGQQIVMLPIENCQYAIEQLQGIEDKTQAILFCLQAANNESGIVNDLGPLVTHIRSHYPNAQILVDACQAFGKLPFDYFHDFVADVDYLAMSAHKIGALAGTGVLLSNKNLNLLPLIYGGSQENCLRAGTHNIHGIVTLVEAMRLWVENGDQYRAIIDHLRTDMKEALSAVEGISLEFEDCPKRLSNSFMLHVGPCVDELFMLLDMAGICTSIGSACSSGSGQPSRVLMAYGFDERRSGECLRVSLHHMNTVEEIDFLVTKLKDFFNK